MRPKTRDSARGKWVSILGGLGLSDRALSGKHGPCPLGCGGKESFRFDNKGGLGTWICTHCGAGDGIGLVAQHLGLPISAAMAKVDSLCGNAENDAARPSERSEADRVSALRRVWHGARPLDGSDPASRYLRSRIGGIVHSKALRVHLALPYRDDESGELTRHPAMIAAVQARNGEVVSIHRTYLTNEGGKAVVSKPKKLMEGKKVAGGAIRLRSATKRVGIAEGIETALAASAIFGLPVWSTISSWGLETFEPPEGIEEVVVFSDNDISFTGQAAAFACAKRLVLKFKVKATVRVPPEPGQDWNDVHDLLKGGGHGKPNRVA